MNKNKLLLIFFIAIALSFIFFFKAEHNTKIVNTHSPAMTVTTTQPNIVDWSFIVEAVGDVTAQNLISISSEISGVKIKDIFIDVGSVVKKDQILAQLDDAALNIAVSEKSSALKKAENALEQAEYNYNNALSLKGTNAISKQQIFQYKTIAKNAKAEVELGVVTLSAAKLNLEHSLIIAPDDGVISSKSANVGAITQNGKELFTIIGKQELEWRAQLSEKYLLFIDKNTKVTIKSGEGTETEGIIRLISPVINPDTREAIIYVSVNDPKLRSGMFAVGKFAIKTAKVLTLPAKSVVNDDGYDYVFVINKDSIVTRKLIKSGDRKDDIVQVLSGVSESDAIVVEGAGFLNEGDLVSVAIQTSLSGERND